MELSTCSHSTSRSEISQARPIGSDAPLSEQRLTREKVPHYHRRCVLSPAHRMMLKRVATHACGRRHAAGAAAAAAKESAGVELPPLPEFDISRNQGGVPTLNPIWVMKKRKILPSHTEIRLLSAPSNLSRPLGGVPQTWVHSVQQEFLHAHEQKEAPAKSMMELSPALFNVDPVSAELISQVVTWQRASWRQGTHVTRTRAEVRGGGAKPWRQKGTGRARHGSRRSPIWVGGGKAFPKYMRDYSYDLPIVMRQQALKHALTLKFRENNLRFVDALEFSWFDEAYEQGLLDQFQTAEDAESGDLEVLRQMHKRDTVKKVLTRLLKNTDVAKAGLHQDDRVLLVTGGSGQPETERPPWQKRFGPSQQRDPVDVCPVLQGAVDDSPAVSLISVEDLNCYDMLLHRVVVFDKTALERLEDDLCDKMFLERWNAGARLNRALQGMFARRANFDEADNSHLRIDLPTKEEAEWTKAVTAHVSNMVFEAVVPKEIQEHVAPAHVYRQMQQQADGMRAEDGDQSDLMLYQQQEELQHSSTLDDDNSVTLHDVERLIQEQWHGLPDAE
ncbi:MAG: hypothetical protein MHM6MM_007128 [Cercozoa sp. M6MM]